MPDPPPWTSTWASPSRGAGRGSNRQLRLCVGGKAALGAGTGCGEPLAAGCGVQRIASQFRGLGDVKDRLCKRRGLGSRQPTGTSRKLQPRPQNTTIAGLNTPPYIHSAHLRTKAGAPPSGTSQPCHGLCACVKLPSPQHAGKYSPDSSPPLPPLILPAPRV